MGAWRVASAIEYTRLNDLNGTAGLLLVVVMLVVEEDEEEDDEEDDDEEEDEGTATLAFLDCG